LEAQTDIQSYLERGKQALAEGQPREAAIAYAHAAQMDLNNPKVHLGLAQANLGLGDERVVLLACRKVQELQPEEGPEHLMAQALLELLERRYDRALATVDRYIAQNPADAYAHALRSYLLSALGQYYDAGLARSRAARLSYGGRFEKAFPPLESSYGLYSSGYAGPSSSPPTATAPAAQESRDTVPAWGRRSQLQRQLVRGRFVLSRHPRLFTYALIVINVIVFLVEAYLSRSFSISEQVLYQLGGEVSQVGDYWRIFTALFLHANILQISLNMLSLFFVGTLGEVFYGKLRYLLIYLSSGIFSGILSYFLYPAGTLLIGASGGIFGVFGALGAFFISNRRALGPVGQSAIYNWLFWLGLNLLWNLFVPGIAIWDYVGGLAFGLTMGFLLGRPIRARRLF
jgi:membrane associated rhomboid family serine protease